MTQAATNTPEYHRKAGKTVLLYLIAFFGIMVVANAAFVYFALSSHTGLHTQNPYEKGIRYNEILDDKRKQEALAWYIESRLENIADKHIFLTTLRDKSGAPIIGATVDITWKSPVSDKMDFTSKLERLGEDPEIANPGEYASAVNFPRKGQWYAYIRVTYGKDSYSFKEMFIVE